MRFSLKSLLVLIACVGAAFAFSRGQSWDEALGLIALRLVAALVGYGLCCQAVEAWMAGQNLRERGGDRALALGLWARAAAEIFGSVYLLYWLVNTGTKWDAFNPYDDAILFLILALTFGTCPDRSRGAPPRWADGPVNWVAGASAASLLLVAAAFQGIITVLVHIAVTGMMHALPNTSSPEIAPYLTSDPRPLFWTALAAPGLAVLTVVALRRFVLAGPELSRVARLRTLALATLAGSGLAAVVGWIVFLGVPGASPVIAEGGWGAVWRENLRTSWLGTTTILGLATLYGAWRWTARPAAMLVAWRSPERYFHESRWTAAIFVAGTVPSLLVSAYNYGWELIGYAVVGEGEYTLWLPAVVAATFQIFGRWPTPEELLRQAAPREVSAVRFAVVWGTIVALAIAVGVIMAAFASMLWLYPTYVGQWLPRNFG